MIYVPAGTFKMGGEQENESSPHDVRVNAFYISKYEITNRQYKAFLDANPEWRRGRIKKGYHNGDYLKHWQGDSYPPDRADHPVGYVSWFAAKAYCEWAGGRLPTEAEWEEACRAGSTGKYCFGDDESKLEDYAWDRSNSKGSSHPVGSKRPNTWGLHDMHGNVWEWCSSKFTPYPYNGSDGREDMADLTSYRVLRGGGWHSRRADACRSGRRANDRPSECYDNGGFRLVVPASGQADAQPAVPEPTHASPKPSGKAWTNPTDGSEMVHVPAGTFKMGNEKTDQEKPVHDVRVDAFCLSKHEITNRQYKVFVDANPEWRKDRIRQEYHKGSYLEYWKGGSYPSNKANHPVVQVSWFAAKEYCEWAGGKLPTEAEWEYACRAGATGTYCFGDDPSKLTDYAWYKANSGAATQPVGQKKPNAWGLYDMHGNVWEWCSSKHVPHPCRADDGREDLSDTGSRRVVRGGGWSNFEPSDLRSSNRSILLTPPFCYGFIGFRLAVSARVPASPQSSASGMPAVAKAPAGTGGTKRRKSRKRPKPFTNKKDGSQMIYVPAGTFKMGGQEGHEGGLVHDVHVDAFYISKHEITNQQWKQFVDANREW